LGGEDAAQAVFRQGTKVPKNRSARDKMMLPGAFGNYIVDTWRGQYRVRKWPKKRGTPTDPVQLSRIERFADANRLAKFVNGNFWNLAHRVTKGTGLYPRDILVQSMLAGQYDIAHADGRLITYKQFFLESAVFQGCTVERTSGQAIAASGNRVITWQNPVIQTVPIWDAGSPTRLTVPTGVDIVRLSLGVTSAAAVNGSQICFIQNQAGVLVAAHSVTQNAGVNASIISRPLYVTPGDWFEAYVFWGAAGTVSANPRSTFCLEILNTI